MRPLWISVEGVNGVGKTYLARALVAQLGDTARLLSELTDGGGDAASSTVITALSAGHSFLRTGHPLTETLALLALKVREQEILDGLPDPPAIVIEDRGVDTVAVYQAAVLAGETDSPDLDATLHRIAERIYDTAAAWRTLPDLTVLLTDDPQVCAWRFADREGRPLAADERELVARAERLYQWRANREPQRFRVLDRAAVDHPLPMLEQLVTGAFGAPR